MRICVPAMVGCCLLFDVLGHSLALSGESGWTAAALAELAKIQWLSALGAERNANMPDKWAVARCTGIGSIPMGVWVAGRC